MGASNPTQVRALLVKNAVYLRRNTATNVCLVVAPIFFCGLLALIQLLANKLILSQRNNKCGCQCTLCCGSRKVQRNWTDSELVRIANGEKLAPRYISVEECSFMDTGYCERNRNASCRAYNDSNCSLRFSSPRQAIFCAIPEPSSWPPVIQTPRVDFRAGGSTTQWLPFTGTNRTAARAVAANLVTPPELPNLQGITDLVRTSPLSLLNLHPSQLLAMVLPFLAPGGLLKVGGESVDAAQVSRLELRFGSALTANNDYYLENAFINSNRNNSRVQFLLPEGQCRAAGISNVTSYTALPLVEMVLRYYNFSFPLIIPPLLRIFNVTPGQITRGLEDSQFGGITAACVDTLPREADNLNALERRLYCGFGKARCDGTYFTREYGGAWNFLELGPTTLKYDAYYNLSLPVPDTPVNYRINELLNMATKAWTQTYWGGLPVVYNVRNRLMGLMSFPKLALQLKLDFSVILGPLFYTWVVQMLMPSLLQQLVYEKEKRLRVMMKMHGLGDGAYWLVTYLWYLMLYIVYIVFFVFFGTMIRLKIFTTTSMSMQAVMFFIFGNNMLAFVFMMSAFFSSSRTATIVAFLYIFASGLIGELLLRSLMQQDKPYMLAVQLVPGFALYRGLFEFSEYSIRAIFASYPGLKWFNLRDPGNGMIGVWLILLAEWPLFMVLGWYFEQVLNSGTGTRRHPLFFLRWMWRKPDADLRELQGMQPHAAAVVEMASGPSGAAAAPPKVMAERLESPPQADGLSERGLDLIPSAFDVNGGDKGDGYANAPDRRRAAGPVAEGVDGSGAGDADAAEEEDEPVGARGGGGGDVIAAMLPGCPMECSNSDGNKCVDGCRDGSSRNTSRADDREGIHGDDGGGCGSKSSEGGGGEGSNVKLSAGRGSGASSSTSSGGTGSVMPADVLVVGAVIPISPRRLQTTSTHRSTGGSSGCSAGGGRKLSATAAFPPASPTGSPSRSTWGGSPGGGSSGGGGSPSVAWAVTARPTSTSTSTSRTSRGAGAGGRTSSSSGGGAAGPPFTAESRLINDGAGEPSSASASNSCEAVTVGMGKVTAATAAAAVKELTACTADPSVLEVGGSGATGSADTLMYASASAASNGGAGAGGRGGGGGGGGGAAANGDGGVAVGLQIQAYDVAAEADRVADMDEQRLLSTPIVVRGLTKIFTKDRAGVGLGSGRGWGWLGACCGGRQRGHVAVRSLTLAIERGECFGLLGPNGAGKSTTIHMLTGFLDPSAGDALVEGRSVRSRMQEIYRTMGVCPQENLLWEQLTGEEHLMFYGRLKGLTGKKLTEAVDAGLKSVKLHVNNAGKRRVGAYSGGMKRRLSVAISFIGNPRIVYLDEPSTGLDPASRRALWDMVREHKADRAVILTTHSMEEAEILCDRLGIFVDGQLVCIGNPREITSRYASYLVFTITVGPGHEDAVRALVARMSPHARVTYSLGGTFKYELPAQEVSLSAVFREVAAAKAEMQVLDWAVANATLEEVFIRFARQIGVETRDQ